LGRPKDTNRLGGSDEPNESVGPDDLKKSGDPDDPNEPNGPEDSDGLC